MVTVRSTELGKPAAPYVGGKRVLSKKIISTINQIPHGIYAEPFVGMGGVFLRRSPRPKMEVINDINGDITNFFRILQRHYSQLMEVLSFQITSRHEFDRLSEINPSTLTDLERAARFLYLQCLAFGGKVRGQTFGISMGGARFNLPRLTPVLREIHGRMAGVVIENLPWRSFIERYDRPNTLFYLDPPYWGHEDDYGKGVFSRDQFREMADVLLHLKGRFILSINDVTYVRDIFTGFEVEEVALKYSIGGGRDRTAKELIITGKAS
jgi:DNA adenine methylase